MDAKIKENLQSKSQWVRGFFMAVVVILFEIAKWLAFLVVFFQFVYTLLSGKPNENIVRFGKELSDYIAQAMQYLTYNSEHKPFPFNKWPTVGTETEQTGA